MISFVEPIKGNPLKAEIISRLDVNGSRGDDRILRLNMFGEVGGRIRFGKDVQILIDRILLPRDQQVCNSSGKDQNDANRKNFCNGHLTSDRVKNQFCQPDQPRRGEHQIERLQVKPDPWERGHFLQKQEDHNTESQENLQGKLLVGDFAVKKEGQQQAAQE